MSCEEPQYWKAKLAELGVEAKGNRYQLRAIYRRLAATPVKEVTIEVLGIVMRFGYVTPVAARAMCCVSRRWRDLVRTAVAALIAEKTNFVAQVSLVLPPTRKAVLLAIGSNREVHATPLGHSTVTVGRKRCDVVLPHSTISLTHLEITPVLTLPEWKVQVRGRHGAVHVRGSTSTVLQPNTEVRMKVGDEIRIPRRVPVYTLHIVCS